MRRRNAVVDTRPRRSDHHESPPPPTFCVILPVYLFLSILAGCDGSARSGDATGSASDANPTLIAEADREHDFGRVIGSLGRTVEHRYHLTNRTQLDVRIMNVVNRKACCGLVRAVPLTLRPGDGTVVDVALLVGDRFGGVVHEAEVVTDSADEPSIVLRTMARAVPPIRVEEEGTSHRTVLVGSPEPRVAAFRVYASGTSAEPPVDLDGLELRSTVSVAWAGSTESCPADAGLGVHSRRFTVTLNSAGPPGGRRAEVVLRRGEQVFWRQVVTWDVVSPIVASPKMLALRPGRTGYSVVLRSQDRKAFHVERIECKTAGFRVRALNPTAAFSQTIALEGVPPPSQRRGVITVFTDHPMQRILELPFVVID